MKRSEINSLIKHAEEFFSENHFYLPPWSGRTPEDWKGHKHDCGEIVENALGWDITNFGSNDFFARGLLLFTIRNGSSQPDIKPYAEKIMVVRENQETPFHFHWKKTEDIINRGGGNLILELCHSTKDERMDALPITVSIDGVSRTFSPGEKVCLTPGESICLTHGIYHRFYGEGGTVLTGEVSVVNDDENDNRFFDDLPRFPSIVEDEAPYRLLSTEYQDWL